MRSVQTDRLLRAWLGIWLLVLGSLAGSLAGGLPASAQGPDAAWVAPGDDAQPRVELYFFWSLTCPHCAHAHPHVMAIPEGRPWVRLHALELSGRPENVRRFQAIVEQTGTLEQAGVPAFLFCGELHFGWDSDETTGALLRQRLDHCRAATAAKPASPPVPEPARPESSVKPAPAPPEIVSAPLADAPAPVPPAAVPAPPPASERIHIPLFGVVDVAALSLPALTLVLAGLDAFNPCAFFVLLFLLSMLTHQKSRTRMLLIGGVFVLVSGLMYFAFMAAWLNVFQLFGHLAWVTIAAGAMAVFVGAVNVKDFFWFEKGLSLSIPESKKPDLFRRARAILSADRLPAMLAATVFLATAANFYELLCTAGFPMVYTRLLTLADLTPAGRYVYLALYNVIYVLPLAAIVAVFAGTLGARKLSEREGRLLKLLSGTMMLGLGLMLLLAPQLITQVGVAFGLMALAIGVTWIAARWTRREPARP